MRVSPAESSPLALDDFSPRWNCGRWNYPAVAGILRPAPPRRNVSGGLPAGLKMRNV